jgi:hypothetical protein
MVKFDEVIRGERINSYDQDGEEREKWEKEKKCAQVKGRLEEESYTKKMQKGIRS